MLLAALLLFYTFFVTHLWGILFVASLKRFCFLQVKSPQPGISNILGMACMAPIVGVLHFFIPIGILLSAFFLVTGFLLAVFLKQPMRAFVDFPPSTLFKFFVLVIIAAISIAARPGSGDIADYHLQAIKWAEHYQNIIGLGNFNRPLASNNSWFNLQALFGWFYKSVYIMNGLFYATCFLYFSTVSENQGLNAYRLVVLAFLILAVKTAFIGSVTPDFLITMLFLLTLDIFLLVKTQQLDSKIALVLLLFLVTWAITIKILAVVGMLLLLPLLIDWFKQKRSWQQLAWLILLLAVIPMCIWFIGNVIISGYLVYPFNQIDLFNVDWKIPAYYFEFDKIVLRSWGRVSGQDVFVTSQLTLTEWLPLWFNRLDMLNKGLACAFAFSVLLIPFWFKKKPAIIFPYLTVAIGFILLMLNGPHARFLFPYFVGAVGLFAFVLAPKFNFQRYVPFAPIPAMVIALFLLVQLYNQELLGSSLVEPREYPQVLLRERNLNGFKAGFTNENNACWDQFPATYYYVWNVQLRTNRVEDGFKAGR